MIDQMTSTQSRVVVNRSSENLMQVAVYAAQDTEIVELALDQLDVVSGGYPVSPPPSSTGG